MNDLPLPLRQALDGFMPPDDDGDRIAVLTAEVARLKTWIGELTTRYDSLLRLPFQFEVCTKPAVRSWGPMGCEAEYATRTANDSVVHEAVDWLIDKHMDELEAKVEKLQKLADIEAQS